MRKHISRRLLWGLAGVVALLAIAGGVALASGTSPSFTFSSDEPGTTFKCALDGGTPVSCTSPHSETGLAPGAHTETIVGAFTVPQPPQVTVAQSCTPSASTVTIGQTLSAKGALKNTGGTSITLQNVVLAGRPPGGTNAGGPYDDFTPAGSNVTIAPGATYTLSASRSFPAGSPTGDWYCYLTYQTADGAWHDDPANAHFTVAAAAPPPPPPPPSTGLHVAGSHLADANGNTVRLHGVNGSSTDYTCYRSPSGVTDGSIQLTQANINNMLARHVNAVRVVLNEDCWLGINGLPTGGLDYRTPIQNWVNLLLQNGMFVIVDLHASAPGTTPSKNQNNMADEDHAPAFWQSVATAFKGDQNVIFDLYNEPHDLSWACWRDGCSLSSWQDGAAGSRVAGMQELVNTVRATGAGNVLMLGCLGWSNDCSDGGGSWLQYKPSDPDNNLVASVHVYETNGCSSSSCFTSQWGPIIQAGYPLVLGEFGDYTPSGGSANQSFAQTVLDWLDQNGAAGETAWTWNNWAGTAMALVAASDGSSLTAWGSYITSQYAARYP